MQQYVANGSCTVRSPGFDTEFDPTGSLLLVSHENNSLDVIDPLSRRVVGRFLSVALNIP